MFLSNTDFDCMAEGILGLALYMCTLRWEVLMSLMMLTQSLDEQQADRS